MNATILQTKQDELMAALNNAMAAFLEENPDIRVESVFYQQAFVTPGAPQPSGKFFRSTMSITVDGATLTRNVN